MKKVLATIILSLSALLFLNPNAGYADLKNINLNHFIKIDDDSPIFTSFISSEEKGKDKFQIRIKDDRFMVKGVIEASSSNSITINGEVITLDSSVTGDTKVVGDIENGMYAHVKGIVEDSSFLATQVVIDQRFKHELEIEDEDEDEDENEDEDNDEELSPTPTLTVTPTPVGTESASIETSTEEEFRLDLSTLITRLQDILNFLTNFVSRI